MPGWSIHVQKSSDRSCSETSVAISLVVHARNGVKSRRKHSSKEKDITKHLPWIYFYLSGSEVEQSVVMTPRSLRALFLLSVRF